MVYFDEPFQTMNGFLTPPNLDFGVHDHCHSYKTSRTPKKGICFFSEGSWGPGLGVLGSVVVIFVPKTGVLVPGGLPQAPHRNTDRSGGSHGRKSSFWMCFGFNFGNLLWPHFRVCPPGPKRIIPQTDSSCRGFWRLW